MLTPTQKTEDGAFLVLLVGVTAFFLWMLLPFFDVIFWAATIGILFHPLYAAIADKWKIGRVPSALLTILICLFLIIIPFSYVLYNCLMEASLLYEKALSNQDTFVNYIDRLKDGYPFIQDWLHSAGYDIERIKSLLTSTVLTASRFLAKNTLTLGENTLGFLTNLALVLYIAFFLLMDGVKLQSLLLKALPFGDHRERLLFEKFVGVTRATVKGSLLVAAAQGALGGVIFWLLDIHAAILWGVVMAVLSLIPVVGAALVWGPVAIYLLLTGDYWEGGILLAYGAGVIGLADNLLRPLLVGRDTKLPDFMVLLSTLAGFVFFGMDGFVTGPTLAVLFVTVWQIFIAEFSANTSRVSSAPASKPATPESPPSPPIAEEKAARRKKRPPSAVRPHAGLAARARRKDGGMFRELHPTTPKNARSAVGREKLSSRRRVRRENA